eukprot:scaffold11935_cov167-Isochrysis_galbana.AAC.3
MAALFYNTIYPGQLPLARRPKRICPKQTSPYLLLSLSGRITTTRGPFDRPRAAAQQPAPAGPSSSSPVMSHQ